jgi:hypothetical protein
MHAIDAISARVSKRASHLLGRQAILLGLLVIFAASLHAQFRTAIQGTVTDPTGAVIPGATLTLTDTATNQTITHTSDENGVYNFNALAPDRFTLTAEKEGFNKKVLADLQLIPEQSNAVNIELQVGNTSQSITVNASTTPALDTQTANNGLTLTANQIEHLPAYERDVTQLIQLTPGVIADGSRQGSGNGFQQPGTQTGASSGGGGNLGPSSSIFATENGPSANTNGQQFQNNGFTVDGISTVSAVWGGATIVTPSVDSVENVRVLSNQYDAENSRFSGAMTQITTKAGSNQIHGSFFWQLTRPGLNAYQRWNGPGSVVSVDPITGLPLTPEARGLQRNTNRYNQLGGSVGGPLWKDKLFAFFSMEAQDQNFKQTGTAWFMTPQLASLAPAGSIASTFLNFPGADPLGTVIASATCADAGLIENVNCRTIAGEGLNIGSPLTTPLGTQDLTYVSAASPGIGSGLSTVPTIAQYSTSNPTTDNFRQYYGRVDANVTSKDLLTFTMYWVPSSITTFNGGLGYDLFNHDQTNNAFALIWNHTFSPTFLNEARANAAGWRWNELDSNPQAPLGLPQARLNGTPQIGSISVGNLGPGFPSHLNQWTYTYKDVATKIFHSHTIKMGGDLTRLYYLNVPISIPNYTFFNIWSFLNDAPEAEGGAFQATTGLPGGFRNDNRENIWGAFIQDDWKIRPGLTINAGLRYNYFGPLTDKNNNMGVLKFGAGTDYLTGITLNPGIHGWRAQKLNFSPQFGFNWNPLMFGARLVVRGGYGLSFNEEQIANANAYDFNPPGTSQVPGSSTSPTNINPNIVYAVSSSPSDAFGYPPNPNTITSFNSAGLPVAGAANLNALPRDLPTQYYHHYSLQVEFGLPWALVASVGYQGSSGKHLLFNYDSNAFGVLQGAPLNPLVNSINTAGSNGFSMNNMMLLTLKHQFSHSFSAEGQYTWAHSRDTNSGPYSRSPYLYDPHFAYGRSDFDVRNYFKLFGVWQPVFFHSNSNMLEKIAGGWTLSGILTLHSGFGWTPTFNAGSNQLYCNLCNYGGASLRPNFLGGAGNSTDNDAFKTGSNFSNPGAIDTGTSNNLFSDNYFSVPDLSASFANLPGQIASALPPPPGNVGRNSFPGPGYRNVDFTFGKAFGLPNMRVIGEHGQIEIKANMFNAFNILNINPSTISTNIANTNLGQAGSALGARTVDFQARFSF